MAFNPFLSMGEPTAPVASDALNPFAAPEVEIREFSDDNPFSGSNPFADFGGYEPPAGDTVPIDLFGTPAPAVGSAMSGVPPIKPVNLPLSPVPPPRPLTAETQNLILSVTGQMDLTSTHLLDRIPPTRTPSPVSVRDIQSPSLTPEPEPESEMELAPSSVQKPVRPPPARPPPVPRPPPPRPMQPPPRPAQPPIVDDINLFDAPAPTVVKPTKEAILSLYSTPKREEEPQIDFLSDDIPSAMNTTPMNLSESKNSNTIGASPFDLSSNAMDTKSFNGKTGNDSPFGNHTPMNIEKIEKESPFSNAAMQYTNENNMFSIENNQELDSKSAGSPFQDTLQSENNNSPFAETFPFTSDVAVPPDAGQATPFATNSGPFSSQTFETDTSPFASEPTDYTADSATFTSENIPFATNVTPFTADNEQFTSNSSPFNVNVSPFTTESSPFNIEQAVHTNDSSPFTTAASPFDSNSISTVVATGTASPFVEETYSTGAADAVFASPFAEAEMVTKESSPFESLGSRRESEGNPFETDSTAYDNSKEVAAAWGAPEPMTQDAFPSSDDAFDAFSAKFDNAVVNHMDNDAWGQGNESGAGDGFEADGFDSFLSMRAPPPPPAATPHAPARSPDSGDDSFSLYIRPKEESGEQAPVPILAPPPKPAPEAFRPLQAESPMVLPTAAAPAPPPGEHDEDAPPTPLFDDDVSMPLEAFPRTEYTGPGWEMQLRQPNKKKITGQRFWKKIWVRLVYQGDSPVVQLLNTATDKEPFQELPLQPCYSVSEVGAQQFDQFGKIFTVKLQYVFYKERPGVRPGQVTKAERLTNKLSAFAAYAIQGDYQGVKEFGSDLRKLGLPVEHAPQVSQLFKIGSLNHEDVKQFSSCVEEALFRLQAHRDRALTYKMEEVQITAVDELYVEQDAEGCVMKQIARVRIFFLGFLNGMPDVELGVNDLRRQGREVVGRHDIIPVVTEEWIRVELPEFHACVQPESFNETQLIRFKPPDACYIEVCRFRVRPPRNRELPLVLRAAWAVRGAKVELRADVLVAGFASRALGQVPCEDVAIRFPVPESWIYLFRVEKHFRYGSVKSAHRRTGKIKGIERFLGAVDTLSESLIEVTSGQAKYEHQHRAVVWRMPRLPKDGQGAYTTHKLVMRLALTSFDQIPAELASTAHVSFVMPAAQVSHVTIRSVSLANHDADPPEKYVRYLARHEYIVGIERTSGESPAAAYEIAVRPPPAATAPSPATVPEAPSSDSDSD